MATKVKKQEMKQETLFVVLDIELGRDAMVDYNGLSSSGAEEVIFEKEIDAIKTAEKALLDHDDFEDTQTLTVFKLVPIVKVKRAPAVVERM